MAQSMAPLSIVEEWQRKTCEFAIQSDDSFVPLISKGFDAMTAIHKKSQHRHIQRALEGLELELSIYLRSESTQEPSIRYLMYGVMESLHLTLHLLTMPISVPVFPLEPKEKRIEVSKEIPFDTQIFLGDEMPIKEEMFNGDVIPERRFMGEKDVKEEDMDEDDMQSAHFDISSFSPPNEHYRLPPFSSKPIANIKEDDEIKEEEEMEKNIEFIVEKPKQPQAFQCTHCKLRYFSRFSELQSHNLTCEAALRNHQTTAALSAASKTADVGRSSVRRVAAGANQAAAGPTTTKRMLQLQSSVHNSQLLESQQDLRCPKCGFQKISQFGLELHMKKCIGVYCGKNVYSLTPNSIHNMKCDDKQYSIHKMGKQSAPAPLFRKLTKFVSKRNIEVCGGAYDSLTSPLQVVPVRFFNRNWKQRKLEEDRTKHKNTTTPQCVLCEAYPTTADGYAYHLQYHHKSTLNDNGIFIRCACGEPIQSYKPNLLHGWKCDRSEFSLHKLGKK